MNNHFKKFSIFAIVILAVSMTTTLISSQPTFAANYVDGTCRNFAGLTSWDCGVVISDEATLQKGIWQIAVNVLTDITVIATYLVIGYVIYGGYLYIFSGGDPTKVAKGRKALTQAFIGLAIVLSAAAIMSTIRFVLLGTGENSNFGACLEQKEAERCTTPADLVFNTINWFIAMAGIVSAIFVVYGGISYTTSAGDPSKLQKAKQMILYSLIGLAIVGLSIAISSFVHARIRESVENAQITSNIIAKEIHEKQT